DSGLERKIVALATGLSLCAVLSLLVGTYSLQNAQILIGVTAFVGLLYLLRRGRKHIQAPLAPGEEQVSWFDTACLLTTSVALFFAFIGVMAPLTSWDATVAHLALPSDYARAGRIFLHPGNVYSGYPHFMHTLFAFAFYPEFEKSASLLSWAMAALACGSVYLLGRRVHSPACGFIAAAIFATAPIFADQAGGISIDLPFVAYATLALAALVAWFDTKNTGWLLIAGFLAGSACGIRHTGYIVCVLLALGVLMGGGERRVRATVLFSLLVLAGAGPWLLRSALLVHNPFFPLFASFFPESPIDHIAITSGGAHETVAATGGLAWKALLRFPYDIIMR
ncbi:MAG TPA: glycosyltransferase family 39 protein, partial [Paracoccaceae bacterium]|nr:glycosyltransferase family 39 protein [Paracoccaceae bacterium]